MTQTFVAAATKARKIETALCRVTIVQLFNYESAPALYSESIVRCMNVAPLAAFRRTQHSFYLLATIPPSCSLYKCPPAADAPIFRASAIWTPQCRVACASNRIIPNRR
jgi:hypothetical protein